MSNYTTNNLSFLLTKYKNEITNDNVEIAFDDEDDGLDIDADLDTSWIEELVEPEFKKKKFEGYLEQSGLKKTTIKNHMRNLDKYEKFGKGNINQDNIYSSISQSAKTKSQKLTITSSLSKYLQFIGKPNDKIVRLIIEINNDLKTGYAERNVNTTYEYNTQKIENEMNSYFDKGMYKHFIISYLVYNYNVRNTDLNLILCKNEPEIQEGYNYLYFNDVEYQELLKDLAAKKDELLKLPLLREKLYKVRNEYDDYRYKLKPNNQMRLRREELLDKIILNEKALDKTTNRKNAEYIGRELRKLRIQEKNLYPPTDEEEYEKFEDRASELETEYKGLLAEIRDLKEEQEDEDEDEEEKKEEFIKYANHYFTPIYFIRNNYKTSKTYGKKTYTILDEKFHIAFHSYRDWLLNIKEDEEETKLEEFEELPKSYFEEQKLKEFEDLQLFKRTALEDKDEHEYFLRKEYMTKGQIVDKIDIIQDKFTEIEENRFTGFMDTFKDILQYDIKKNIKPKAKIPYIKYKKTELQFIGNPDYWQEQFELITEYMRSNKYKNWEIEKEQQTTEDLKKLIENKELEIFRVEKQYKTTIKYNVNLLVPDKIPRISFENDKLVFYGDSRYWNKEISIVKKRLKKLKEELVKLKEQLKQKTIIIPKEEIIFGEEIEFGSFKGFGSLKKAKEEKEMKGGGRISKLQKRLKEEEKILSKIRNPAIRELKKRELARVRKEEEEEEEQEKQKAKQKRKEEVAEQRRQRLAVYREKRVKEARERREKEQKLKQQKKDRREARKELLASLGADKRKTRKHDKPAGVIIYPDTFKIKIKIKSDKLEVTPPYNANRLYRYYNADYQNKNVIKDCVYLFSQPIYNSTNIVKRYLPYNLKTSDILKIILKENNSLTEAYKIGQRRGTSLQTLQDSYNLNG
jgi:hypothetical protein